VHFGHAATPAEKMTSNKENHSIVAIFDAHQGAEAALEGLQRAELDMRQVSVVAKDFYTRGSRETR
jgi:hypothetical protein